MLKIIIKIKENIKININIIKNRKYKFYKKKRKECLKKYIRKKYSGF